MFGTSSNVPCIDYREVFIAIIIYTWPVLSYYFIYIHNCSLSYVCVVIYSNNKRKDVSHNIYVQ